jgi:hypothetical protein
VEARAGKSAPDMVGREVIKRGSSRDAVTWTKKNLWIVQEALKLPAESFLTDGKAVVLRWRRQGGFRRAPLAGVQQVAAFVQLCSTLARRRGLARISVRHAEKRLQRLLIESDGVRFCEHLDGDGPIIIEHVWKEGARRNRIEAAGSSPTAPAHRRHGLKYQSPASAAMRRIQEDGPWSLN